MVFHLLFFFVFFHLLTDNGFPSLPEALLEFVREELGANAADELIPLVHGGVQLHKIFGVMHDTCHTANRVARLMVEMREEKARAYHGDDEWDVVDPCQKVVHDFFCGNHSRNLLSIGLMICTMHFWFAKLVKPLVMHVRQVVGVCGWSARAFVFCVQFAS